MSKTKQIRLLQVSFNLELNFNELNNFRGAIIKTTEGVNDLFHNHSSNGNIYRYPRIQYKLINKKATLFCIDDGVEGIQDFFSKTNWKLAIGKEEREIRVDNIRAMQYRVGVWENSFDYKLKNWLPLNQENYQKFKAIEDLSEQIVFFEKILLSNILSFIQGIDFFIEDRIVVKIKSIDTVRLIEFKGQQMQSYSIIFRTNVSLPNLIGLGKGSSIGFGIIKEINTKNQITND